MANNSTNRLSHAAMVRIIVIGVIITISGFSVVRAEHVRPASSKTFTCSKGTACLTGRSAGEANGVEGVSTATSGHAYGVEGTSSNGDGVFGITTANNADNPQAGVRGDQVNTKSDSGNGVYAESADTTQLYEALFAEADTTNADIFEALNAVTGASCTIDANANFTCNGSGEAKRLRLRHRTDTGRQVLAYGSESARATLENAGSARLVGGVADVALDPTFGATIDRSSAYRVFLTPTGDTRGLYVSAKTPAGFQVREIQGGRSTISFDYRIVAQPLDERIDRLSPDPALGRDAAR